MKGQFSRTLWLIAVFLFAPGFLKVSHAQDCPPQTLRSAGSGSAKTIRMPCTTQAPVIDGQLDDAVWKKAATITDFTQVEPVEGAEPSEKTEVRLLYSPDAVYIAIRAFDSEPNKIDASIQVRDESLPPDDHVIIVLGSYGNGRDAFAFLINPLGSRRDILVENNSELYGEWNGIWYAKAQINDQGWFAELEIPVKTLAFKPRFTDWDFNVIRVIRRKNENVRWAAASQDLFFFNVSRTGQLTGLRGLDQGWGLDVKTEGAISYSDDNVAGTSGFEFNPSANLFYKITPSLTGSLTVNTDFAEAEVDERRVNLSRFSLFFPETRDFFLQDVGIFQFADFGTQSRVRDPNGRPFFTRRIGLVEGNVVDIVAGGKITGRAGDVNIGLLDVQTESHDKLGIGSKNLAVGRVSVNLLGESSVGAIFTHGNPSGPVNNTLVGSDFRYRNSSFLGDRVLEANLWIQKSWTEGLSGDQEAFGGMIAYPNDRISGRFRFTQLGENFNPALGFVNRVGIRLYEGFLQYRWRPENFLRTVDLGQLTEIVTDTDNDLESLSFFPEISFRTESDDRVSIALGVEKERLKEPFLLPSNISIPPGDYTFVRPQLEIGTSSARTFAIDFEVECCEYFNGRNLTLEGTLDIRPSRYFFISLSYEQDKIKVPGGTGTIRVGAMQFNVNFTPDIQWSNIIQYDNVSDNLGINSRFRWIVRPGSEVFLVINQSFLAEEWNFRSQRTEATIKFGHTFRF